MRSLVLGVTLAATLPGAALAQVTYGTWSRSPGVVKVEEDPATAKARGNKAAFVAMPIDFIARLVRQGQVLLTGPLGVGRTLTPLRPAQYRW